MSDDGFDELRKTLARAQEILEKVAPDVTKPYVDPVVGQKTPMASIVLVQGVGTYSREILIKDIWKKIDEAAHLSISTAKDYNLVKVYHALYESGVLKAMIETAIKHEGLEL